MQIEITRTATRRLTGLPRNLRDAMIEKIQALALDPASQANNIKKLKGEGGCRLRVGDWRVFYRIGDDTITVLDIQPRGSAYKK